MSILDTLCEPRPNLSILPEHAVDNKQHQSAGPDTETVALPDRSFISLSPNPSQ